MIKENLDISLALVCIDTLIHTCCNHRLYTDHTRHYIYHETTMKLNGTPNRNRKTLHVTPSSCFLLLRVSILNIHAVHSIMFLPWSNQRSSSYVISHNVYISIPCICVVTPANTDLLFVSSNMTSIMH